MSILKVRNICIFTFFFALALNSFAENTSFPTDDVSTDEINSASTKLKSYYNFLKIPKDFRSLDGKIELELLPPLHTDQLKAGTTQEENIKWLACDNVYFAEAKLIRKKSFFGKDKMGIYTKYTFEVVDNWLPNNNTKKHVQVIVLGGEVDFQGDSYRLNDKLKDYDLGASYLVITGSKKKTDKLITYEDQPFMEITNGMLYAAQEFKWSPFAPGTQISTAKKVVTIVAGKECAK